MQWTLYIIAGTWADIVVIWRAGGYRLSFLFLGFVVWWWWWYGGGDVADREGVRKNKKNEKNKKKIVGIIR